MSYLRRVVFLLSSISVFLIIVGQTPQAITSAQLRKLKSDSLKNRPDLGIEVNTVAKLKIALRKKSYLPGETMVLDAAILTKRDEEYYFPPLYGLKVNVKDKSGKVIDVNPFLIVDRWFSPYRLRGGLEVHSIVLNVGCRQADLSFPIGIDDTDDEQEIFKKNLFISKGDSCINFANTGNYEISVELSNDLVIIPESEPAIRTAVGNIRSNTLQIFFKR